MRQAGIRRGRTGVGGRLRGPPTFIVAYDVSHLAQNARLVLNLHHALELSGAELRVVQVPDARFSTPEGRF